MKTSVNLLQTSELGSITDTLFYNDALESKVNLPSYYGFGLAYYNEFFTIGFDYKLTKWSDVVAFNSTDKYTDAQNFIFGVEYTPRARNAQKYFQRMQYRLSGNYSSDYMKISDEQLKGFGIAFGVGLPMRRSKSSINVNFSYGKIGTLKSDALNQTYYKIGLDLSLHDIWFIKRKYD
jgi:hypothetical protein